MTNFILSFPQGTLAETPLRLQTAAVPGEIAAVFKPAGTPAEKIIAETNKRLAGKQPSFSPLGFDKIFPVYCCEPEISGIILVAGTQTCSRWRDILGSRLMKFYFEFIAGRVPEAENAFFCDLPVAKHFTENRAVVSSTTGKKSRTEFYRVSGGNTFEKWRAETSFPRFHQIRIHAKECGLLIAGDEVYNGVPAITVSSLRPKKRLNKGEDKALYPNVCLHLARIDIPAGGNTVSFCVPAPKGLTILEKKLGLFKESPSS